MAKSATASVMVLIWQPLFVRLRGVFVEHFVEVVNEALMKLPSNPGNGISNSCQ